jgi:TPR repeat protein
MKEHPADGQPGDAREALRWYLKAAEKGDRYAMDRVTQFYTWNNREVKEDLADQVAWYRRAAAAGSTDAMVHLGQAYQYGRGVAQDVVEALKWYKLALDADGSGADPLASVYYNGFGEVRWDAYKTCLYSAISGILGADPYYCRKSSEYLTTHEKAALQQQAEEWGRSHIE